MVTFRDYLLEYAKKEDSIFFGISKLKAHTKNGAHNGKDYNRAHTRKHINTVAKEYNHKHPIINSICQGKADNIPVIGSNLNSILNLYNMVFEIGLKTIGNSGVEIEMSEDEEGRQRGMLRNKKKKKVNIPHVV
jgi:hypothetical protein